MRTQLGIPFRRTKINANSRNSVLNHSVEEKPTQNKTRQPNILKIVSAKTTFDVQTNHFVKLVCCCFVKLIFSAKFHSVPSFGIVSSAEFGMNAFFRGITEIVPSLFRRIFSEGNSVPNPRQSPRKWTLCTGTGVHRGRVHGWITSCVHSINLYVYYYKV
jgi:hypothetical protein